MNYPKKLSGLFRQWWLLIVIASGWILLFTEFSQASTDPWHVLREQFVDHEQEKVSVTTEDDAWSRLRTIYLPFSEAEEQDALMGGKTAGKVTGSLQQTLRPFADSISAASLQFNVPPEVIGAVIMVESGGNPLAQAPTSTAKGLMQTIDATFAEARDGLQRLGIEIVNNPFDPHASILAGTWYLNKVYSLAQKDKPTSVKGRAQLGSWLYPAQYYYAGPGNGRKSGNIVIIYSGKQRVVVDKAAYSDKVMRWAHLFVSLKR